MKINGLIVDTETIGAGVYQIIVERGEEALVAFGMIPKWAMDMTEKELREKIIAEAAKQYQCSVEELRPYVSEELLRDTVNPIMREIGSAIYSAASKAGKMIV